MALRVKQILSTVAAAMASWSVSAQQQSSPEGPGADFFIFIIVLVGVMYLMMIRPQMKKAKQHKEMVDGLRKGDEVVTSGGLFGRVRDTGKNFILIELAQGVEVKLQKSAVTSVLPKGTIQDL